MADIRRLLSDLTRAPSLGSGQEPWRDTVFGSIAPYEPSRIETLRNSVTDATGSEKLADVADYATPMGWAAFALDEGEAAGRARSEGRMAPAVGHGLLAAAGVLPIPQAISKPVAQVAKKAMPEVVEAFARSADDVPMGFAQGRVKRANDKPLEGLPTGTDAEVGAPFGPNLDARKAAVSYMRGADLPYNPPTEYIPVDPKFASRVATAFDKMKHQPNHPEVRAAYDALARELPGQYDAMAKKGGVKVDFMGDTDPYAVNPRLATQDIADNKHLSIYPTEDGFGSSNFDPAGNPLLDDSGRAISGQPAKVNDLFRAVHDYYGHAKEGLGFRASGEDNAYRAHQSMFSPEAARAMGTETRGQNSWVNFGPEGEFNRTASGADTIYADQKTGLLPNWALGDGPAPRSLDANLGWHFTNEPERIIDRTARDGGYSVNLNTGDVPTEGLMMGKYSNADPRNTIVEGAPDEAALIEHARKNRTALADDSSYFGSWSPEDDGMTYLDVSKRFEPDQLRQAVKYGERTGQLAGYNLGTKQEFPVGNWDEFINGPEFQGRMDQMNQEGMEYLAGHPADEWWDMHGTAFERIYGVDRLPQVAGFTATTAPNTAPRQNLQVMSEYMRRHIKGEPVVQPDYRVPETAMGGASGPGLKMGMETGRKANLEKSNAGLYDQLGGDKVGAEAKAMMGDPNVGVYDRHWARIAEKPEANIFTGTQEGVIPRGKTEDRPYNRLHRAVSEGAKRSGMNVRDYSANVWTGIRNRIQKTGELFGQKHDASAITGESKSYSDHLDDLVAEKAKHLGISVPDMEKRLRSGDAELLSIMLAVPGLAQLAGDGEEPLEGNATPQVM